MVFLSQQELERLVGTEYERLRAAWFPTLKPSWLRKEVWLNSQQPAALSFVWDDLNVHCGYLFKENRLVIAADHGWLNLGNDL